jgi:hypothetical protein
MVNGVLVCFGLPNGDPPCFDDCCCSTRDPKGEVDGWLIGVLDCLSVLKLPKGELACLLPVILPKEGVPPAPDPPPLPPKPKLPKEGVPPAPGPPGTSVDDELFCFVLVVLPKEGVPPRPGPPPPPKLPKEGVPPAPEPPGGNDAVFEEEVGLPKGDRPCFTLSDGD